MEGGCWLTVSLIWKIFCISTAFEIPKELICQGRCRTYLKCYVILAKRNLDFNETD